MSKKEIKIITYGNFPYGGASANYIRHLSLSLAINNSVEVIIPNGYYFGKSKNKKRKGEIGNVKFKYLGFVNHPVNYIGKLLDNLLSYLLVLVYLFKTTNKPKVIIVYNIIFTQVIPVLLAKVFLKSSRFIVILPEFYEKPENFLSKLKWYNFYYGISYLVKYFSGAIVLSQYLKDIVFINSKGKVKTLVIPNLLDPSVFNLNNIKPFEKDKITIGYCGTPTRKDGAIDLIKSFSILNKKYKNTHLLVIGDITNGNTIIPKLKNLAYKMNVLDCITFTGLVDHAKVPELLNSCQILALTRPNGVFAEAGFPTKLGEYFACKKPVLVTKVGDIPRYFTNEKEVILVAPENINDIAKGFEKLILSEKLRNRIAEEAYHWMLNNLSYIKLSNKLNTFIRKLSNE
jgi:glycosyltransferase involved in cell wall biosynthesis